ncbi:MFS transporter [Streptomyces sp. NPDC020951]|uniref:MFS transporter n=1 Tax=Streptomyces sp. NPDC020951 TaxID=3365104 RepID=UPI0037B9DF9A
MFAVVAAGVLMANLDLFIVNVALPQIGSDLDDSPLSSVSWVLNAYAVVFAALLVPAGNFADRFGARATYLAGTGVFTLASLACAVAPNIWALVALRGLQAAGAAALIPASLGLLLAAAPPEKRLGAIRGWTAVSGIATLGPAAGGLLTEISWRWVFLVNVPIGLVVLLAGPRLLPRTPARTKADLPDLLGAALFTAAIGVLALGLVKSPEWGWTSAEVLGSLIGGVLLLALFVLRSARAASPVLPLDLLRLPTFATASFASLLFAIPFAALLLSCVLWLQNVWHWSPLATGLGLAPGPLMVPVLALGAAGIVRRFGPALVSFAGCAVFVAGIAWWLGAMHADSDYATGMLPGMMLTGIGVGLTMPTLIGAGITAVPPQSFSTGSGVVTMARQLGSVLGVALLVAILDAESTGTVRAFDRGWWFTGGCAAVTGLACLCVGRTFRRRAD